MKTLLSFIPFLLLLGASPTLGSNPLAMQAFLQGAKIQTSDPAQTSPRKINADHLGHEEGVYESHIIYHIKTREVRAHAAAGKRMGTTSMSGRISYEWPAGPAQAE